MMQPSAYIGIYDSGLGGLGVWRSLAAVLPEERVIYVGDTARVPYGTRSAAEIQRFSREIISFMHRNGAKLVVVACNTSSALALPVLAGQTPMPLIGMISPAVREAIKFTATGRVGLLATPATVGSKAYEGMFAQLAPHIRLTAQGCPRLVPLIEVGALHTPEMTTALREYMEPLMRAAVDCIILGCTHYPAVIEEIRNIAGPDVTIIDPADAVAAETKSTLAERQMLSARKAGEDRVYITGDPVAFEKGASALGFQLPGGAHSLSLPVWEG